MQSFSVLSISPSLKERLTAARFSTPAPVQAAAIPQALEGKDVIATAQTGTGKTLAFLIPVMEELSAQKAAGRALSGCAGHLFPPASSRICHPQRPSSLRSLFDYRRRTG